MKVLKSLSAQRCAQHCPCASLVHHFFDLESVAREVSESLRRCQLGLCVWEAASRPQLLQCFKQTGTRTGAVVLLMQNQPWMFFPSRSPAN